MSDPTDPVIDLEDKLPVSPRRHRKPETARGGRVPFGLRLAISPLRSGKHGRTYYTVTVKEATQVSRDGKVETVQDDVQRERTD